MPLLLNINQTQQVTDNITKSDTLTSLVNDLEIAGGMKYAFLAQGTLIVFINITLAMFIILRKKIRKNLKNCILASLFLSHAIMGILCCFLPYRGKLTTTIIDYGSAAMLATFCNLMVVTLDRFLAIRYPLIYSKVTTTSVAVALILVWLVPIIFGMITTVYYSLTHLAFVMATSACMLVLLVENCVVYYIVRKQCKNIRKLIVPSDELINEREKPNQTAQQANHQRAFFICIAMVLSYVIAWLPALIYVFFDSVLNKKIANKAVLNLIVFLALCNSITDPIIYTWFNRGLKTTIKQFVSERRARAMTQLSLMEHSK